MLNGERDQGGVRELVPATGQTILVIDRDLGFVVALGQTLAMAGYHVVPASDFHEAMNLVRETKSDVDLAVVDWEAVLPMRLLNTRSQRPVPIVLAIEATRQFDRRRSGEIGVAAALRKPKTAEPLPADRWLTTVRRLLQTRGFLTST